MHQAIILSLEVMLDVRLLVLSLGTLHYGSSCNLPHAFDYGFLMIRPIFRYITLWMKLQFTGKTCDGAASHQE
jgi:hypothetical protein